MRRFTMLAVLMLATAGTIGCTPPPAPGDTVLTSTPPLYTNNRSGTFGFTSGGPATFECAVDSSPWVACTSPFTTAPLPDGTHSFAVRATDTATGTTDPTPATFSWTVDTAPPHTTITAGPPAVLVGTSAHFEFSANEPAVFACSLNGAAFTPCISPTNVTSQFGVNSFAVRATDLAGNVETTPPTWNWTSVL